MRILLYYNLYQVIQLLSVFQVIVKQEGKRVGKTFDHRNLPDPLFEQIKHLERQLEKAKNGDSR